MPSEMMAAAGPVSQPRVLEFAAHPTLVVRGTTRGGDEVGPAIIGALGPVYGHLRAKGLGIPGHNVVRYEPCFEGALKFEAGVLTPTPITGDGVVVASELPGGRVAVLTHLGEYEGIPQVGSALAEWCRLNGHTLAGPSWEEYGDWEDVPARRRTDIYLLLA